MSVDTIIEKVVEQLNEKIMDILTRLFNTILSVGLFAISIFIIYYAIRFMMLENNEDSQKIIFLYFLLITVRILNALIGVKY